MLRAGGQVQAPLQRLTYHTLSPPTTPGEQPPCRLACVSEVVLPARQPDRLTQSLQLVSRGLLTAFSGWKM